ncbi:SDR family oxidoreductase [Virgibacillus xinjiangensis]|uniref:SDR family oxidoreductase n=1 Tax=Virgibacillus xinjiangensis TaxID=393090 RepID=A0ABV7CWG1_9BACI
MKVLVAGAHGHTGKLLVKNLRAEGHEPYAMVRKEEQKAEMEELGGIPVLGDLESESDVGRAVKGMEVVMFAAGSGSGTGPNKTTDVDRDGAIRLIDATEKDGIKKFVMLSSMGAGDPTQVEGTFRHYLQMKHEADEHLKKSELDYTIVRPGALTKEPGTSKIKVGDTVGRGEIPREDVAKTMISALQEPNAYHKTFEMISGDTQIEDALRSLS